MSFIYVHIYITYESNCKIINEVKFLEHLFNKNHSLLKKNQIWIPHTLSEDQELNTTEQYEICKHYKYFISCKLSQYIPHCTKFTPIQEHFQEAILPIFSYFWLWYLWLETAEDGKNGFFSGFEWILCLGVYTFPIYNLWIYLCSTVVFKYKTNYKKLQTTILNNQLHYKTHTLYETITHHSLF